MAERSMGGHEQWKLVIHPDTPKQLEEVFESNAKETAGRASNAFFDIRNNEKSKKLALMTPLQIYERGKDTIYWSMLRMHALYLDQFRHFIVIHTSKDPNWLIPGVDVMTIDEFEHHFKRS